VSVRRDGRGDLDEMRVHRLCVAAGHNQSDALALLGADGTEDVGRGGTLIAGRAGAGIALRPPARDLVLLADARFVLHESSEVGGEPLLSPKMKCPRQSPAEGIAFDHARSH
jgi:hypothetical protein